MSDLFFYFCVHLFHADIAIDSRKMGRERERERRFAGQACLFGLSLQMQFSLNREREGKAFLRMQKCTLFALNTKISLVPAAAARIVRVLSLSLPLVGRGYLLTAEAAARLMPLTGDVADKG